MSFIYIIILYHVIIERSRTNHQKTFHPHCTRSASQQPPCPEQPFKAKRNRWQLSPPATYQERFKWFNLTPSTFLNSCQSLPWMVTAGNISFKEHVQIAGSLLFHLPYWSYWSYWVPHVPPIHSVDVTTVREHSNFLSSLNFTTGSALLMPGIWRQKWLPARYHSQSS